MNRLFGILLFCALGANGQNYPDKPLRLIAQRGQSKPAP
jgi:hypothetical protein